MSLPDTQIVIIGGGAVGCAVAYHLAEAGISDVLVLEKEQSLAAVTTAQAAGLVGQVRTTVERTRLAMWSVRTFGQMQSDPDVNPSWRPVGSLRVALTDRRVAEFDHLQRIADEAGLEVERIDAARASQLWPMSFDRAKAILWCPSDGYLQPHDLTMCYRHHARQSGVRFQTGVRVEQIVLENGAVAGVETNHGSARCETIINAAGAHAYHIAQMVGLELPIVPVRHEYLITVAAPGLVPTLPCVRVPDSTLYLRPDVNALLLGGWEPNALSLLPMEYQPGESPPPIEPDWEVLSQFVEAFEPEFAPVAELGVRSVFSGWPTFTPDGKFIVGPSSQVRGFVMAGGCNAHGVSGSAGIGKHVVESMLEADPSPYVRALSPDRFVAGAWDWSTAQKQAQRIYETYYACSE